MACNVAMVLILSYISDIHGENFRSESARESEDKKQEEFRTYYGAVNTKHNKPKVPTGGSIRQICTDEFFLADSRAKICTSEGEKYVEDDECYYEGDDEVDSYESVSIISSRRSDGIEDVLSPYNGEYSRNCRSTMKISSARSIVSRSSSHTTSIDQVCKMVF